MHCTMMTATQGDRELIADLAAERARLGESEVVGVRGFAAAQETRLLGDIAKVLPVAIAPRGSEREDALVDAAGLITRGTGSLWLLRRRYLRCRGTLARQSLACIGR